LAMAILSAKERGVNKKLPMRIRTNAAERCGNSDATAKWPPLETEQPTDNEAPAGPIGRSPVSLSCSRRKIRIWKAVASFVVQDISAFAQRVWL
jgi:hypothetical protein